MSGPNPFIFPSAWSTITLIGKGKQIIIPGIISAIDGHDAEELWIVQKANNSSWAATIWRGRLLNESIKIDLTIADSGSFSDYEAAKNLLQPKPPAGSSPGSFLFPIGKMPTWTVVNAALNWGGITKVGVRSMGTPRAQKDLSWTAKVNLIQYRQAQLAKVGPPDPPKADTENDRKAALTKVLFARAKQVSQ